MKKIVSLLLVLTLICTMVSSVSFLVHAEEIDSGSSAETGTPVLPPLTPEADPEPDAPVEPVPSSEAPTQAPTEAPTQAPTQAPTEAPTQAPTQAPTEATQPSTEATQPSTEATQPSTEATQPTQPTQPSTEATQPTQPTQPSTEATQPTQAPTQPTRPTQPTQPTRPTTPTQPTQPTQAPTEAPTQAPTEAPTQAPTQAPTEYPTDYPTEYPTEAPTQAPTQAPQGGGTGTFTPSAGIPRVTKDPTSETVKEGGFAEFIATADYCESIIWHLLSPTTGTDILVEDAPKQFIGLMVTGLGTDHLTLDRIPKELNEWRVRAEFIGSAGNAWSASAIINVINQELKAPVITDQPKSVSLKATEATILRVIAETSEFNSTLTYQWYRNTTNSNVGGKAILGANSDTFTPDRIEGTTYYYCAVRSSTGNDISSATKSECAGVTYEALTAANIAEPTTIVIPGEPDATGETLATGETTETDTAAVTAAPKKSNSLLVIVVGAIIAIAVLGIIATVIILRFYPRGEDEYEDLVFADDEEGGYASTRTKKKADDFDDEYDEDEEEDDEEDDDEDWDDMDELNVFFGDK